MYDQKKEIIETVSKSVFGAIPYIGDLLNEVVFEHRSRIKQKRINAFIEEIMTSLESIDPAFIDVEYIKSENFSDFFESILKKASEVNSAEKIKKLSDLFAKEIRQPYCFSFKEYFLSLLVELSEKEIEVLYYHSKISTNIAELESKKKWLGFDLNVPEIDTKNPFTDAFNSELSPEFQALLAKQEIDNEIKNAQKKELAEKKRIEKEIEKKKEIDLIQRDIDAFSKYQTPEFYGISQSEYLIFAQHLLSRGLFYDSGIPFTYMEVEQMRHYMPTSLGLEFIKFLRR